MDPQSVLMGLLGIGLALLLVWVCEYPSSIPKCTAASDREMDANAIGRMKNGDAGWTVPWALSEGRAGINRFYFRELKPGGTVNTRLEMKDGVIHAYPPTTERDNSDAAWPDDSLIEACIHWQDGVDCG